MSRLLLSVLLLTGCATETLLVVEVRTDYVSGIEFTSVRTEVEGGPTVNLAADPNADFAASQRAAEITGLPEGMRRVTVSLLMDDRLVASRDVLVEVRASVAATVLLSRDCGGVVCPGPDDSPDATACVGGVCADPRCSEEATEFCPDPECASDADCTGAEGCFAPGCYGGFCVFGQGNTCGPDEYCYPGRGCLSIGPQACDATAPCVCDAGTSCTFECPGGGCTFDCRSSAACFIDCAGGGCATSCAPTAHCDVTCADSCTIECAFASSCSLECGAGESCDASACPTGCSLSCVAGSCFP